ncbi:FAD-dependent pyridine nucleotide-disulfide oxidoreductase [Rhizobiales bacterium RZME27]|uniref:FAD-dependent pyridine nucleotide-disulfide oxidoreductase n=1 Tax=Endobacterium cereale TaxID=2663029 RepID=A0A6A8ADQ3_9HYPH|nr:FAD/NAD(P)-binding protein [Endobacterium cereale]MEB2847493.1 FAD/NAD(P)-binding protein [Endobacterium cereale]MQY48048.1 FAD-dependent pyridine nucleotide-disulfide oxidoreductase [Endobacterium cereale]
MLYDVAVVGSGFSAIAVTINLLRSMPDGTAIAVVGDDVDFGRGTAYRTEFHLHRLNVPAARMSVFCDVPDDFRQWLASNGRPSDAQVFASRGDYGLYLRDRFAALLRERRQGVRVDFLKSKAKECMRRAGDGYSFHLTNDTRLDVKSVVLCLGLGNADLPVAGADASDRIVANPWRLKWLSTVEPEEEICILGSGLTMIDQVLAMREHGHKGRIHVLSRRGLVPLPHATDAPPAISQRLPEHREISAILRSLRDQVRQGSDWRAVMDGLRPHTQALWQSLRREQRSRFLRHGLAWWNIHRHRLAPPVRQRFEALLEDGTVVVHAGYLKVMEQHGERVRMAFRKRGRPDMQELAVDRVINCTGMERAGLKHSPLLLSMQQAGILLPDTLGLGIIVDDGSQVCDVDGKAQQGLYAVGALTASQFWEITAVPDIRVQAKDVAERVAAGR